MKDFQAGICSFSKYFTPFHNRKVLIFRFTIMHLKPFVSSLLLLILFFTSLNSCVYTEKIKDGRTAYERKQYSVAADLLQKEYENAKEKEVKAVIAYYLGNTYQRLNDTEKSMRWYFESSKAGFGSEATLEFARALKREERYQESILAFQKAGRESGDETAYRGEVSMVELAMVWQEEAKDNPYKIKRLPFNSPFFDYAPFPMEGNQLIFTSDRPESPGADTYKWTGNKFSSIYIAGLYDGQADLYESIFTSQHNEGTFTMTRDGSKAAFTRCDPSNTFDIQCKIYYLFKDRSIWSEPILFDYTQDDVNYSYPALSEDGKLMIFSANYPNNQGGYDLYVSEFNNGIWQEPVPLSSRINTGSNEISPFLFGDTLYFASDRVTGMGGYDIYRSELDAQGNWSPPINLKAPINSGADDFSFVIDHNANLKEDQVHVGYFTSSRKGGVGKDDIYFFEKLKPVIDSSSLAGNDDENEDKFIINLNLVTQEKEFEIPNDPNSPVKFRKPIGGVLVEVFKNGQKIEEFKTDDFGNKKMQLENNANYEFIGRKEEYISNRTRISTRNMMASLEADTLIQGRILLEKIYYDKEIVLENIYYDFDRWEIRPDAEPTLDELVELLSINRGLLIQIASHTDCRGAEDYNQILSQRRAQSVVDYLIANQINADRLIARGFGESQPAVNCVCEDCTEEEHQINRRTTFAIVKE